MEQRFGEQNYWEDAWVRHLDTYLVSPPRCGYWLAARFPVRDVRMFEIAGGSCRDSRFLAELGCDAIGSDFEQKTLEYLHKRFPNSPLKLKQEDAFAFTLPDKSVDLSFSNGFWICFDNDDSVHKLIREQARVTRKYLIALVHNADNPALAKLFREKAKTDTLYDVRFYGRSELQAIIAASGIRYRSLRFFKFGAPIDLFLNRRIKGLPNPFHRIAKAVVPKLYEWLPWSKAERIACVIELD